MNCKIALFHASHGIFHFDNRLADALGKEGYGQQHRKADCADGQDYAGPHGNERLLNFLCGDCSDDANAGDGGRDLHNDHALAANGGFAIWSACADIVQIHKFAADGVGLGTEDHIVIAIYQRHKPLIAK